MYVCMHRMRVPLRRRQFPCSSWGWSVQLQFLVHVCSVYTCIQKCMYSQIVCNCFGDLLFVNFECSLFAFYWFLLSFCCFTSLQLHGLWNVVDRRTSNQEFLLSEVDPRETVKTSFWTLAFFQSWSELMVVVLLDHCQGEIRTISVWLLYLDVVFHTGLELSLAPHIGWVNWVFPPRGTVSLFPLF